MADGRKRIKVLIVDDSLAMCRFLKEMLNRDDDLEVVGFAQDPYEARPLIKSTNPDVLTLDVEMPRMDGLTFLRNLMRLRPMPVVMLSSLTAAGAETTLEALSIGAVDFMVKRHPGDDVDFEAYIRDIAQRVKDAARARLPSQSKPLKSCRRDANFDGWARRVRKLRRLGAQVARVVGIGASTGGPEAVRSVLEHLYLEDSVVLISQHMPGHFMGPFARRLNTFSRFEVAEATDGAVLRPGCCYVAPGDRHLRLADNRGRITLKVGADDAWLGHRPSVDVMFKSMAEVAGDASVGVLLTGMGKDGAEGLLALRNAGAFTVAQDEQSSAVWGMPGSAVRCGGADSVMTLRDIGPTLQALLTKAR